LLKFVYKIIKVYKKRMSFVEKKAKNLFLRFDTDGNGTLEEDDLEKWTDKLIELRNLDVDKQDEIRKQMKKIWKEFFLPADFDKGFILM
jgi:hypothetical protein